VVVLPTPPFWLATAMTPEVPGHRRSGWPPAAVRIRRGVRGRRIPCSLLDLWSASHWARRLDRQSDRSWLHRGAQFAGPTCLPPRGHRSRSSSFHVKQGRSAGVSRGTRAPAGSAASEQRALGGHAISSGEPIRTELPPGGGPGDQPGKPARPAGRRRQGRRRPTIGLVRRLAHDEKTAERQQRCCAFRHSGRGTEGAGSDSLDAPRWSGVGRRSRPCSGPPRPGRPSPTGRSPRPTTRPGAAWNQAGRSGDPAADQRYEPRDSTTRSEVEDPCPGRDLRGMDEAFRVVDMVEHRSGTEHPQGPARSSTSMSPAFMAESRDGTRWPRQRQGHRGLQDCGGASCGMMTTRRAILALGDGRVRHPLVDGVMHDLAISCAHGRRGPSAHPRPGSSAMDWVKRSRASRRRWR